MVKVVYWHKDYFAGIDDIRKSKRGEDLPNPREISKKLFSNDKITSTAISALVAGFGQFVAHDLAASDVKNATCCDESTSIGKVNH